MIIFFYSFLVGLIFTSIIVFYSDYHKRFTGDFDTNGVQKFHYNVVPRIGGLGIFLGIGLILFYFYSTGHTNFDFVFYLLICSFPAFISGLLEDITKKFNFKIRFIFILFSAILASYILNARIESIQILGLDNLFINYPLFSIIITILAVVGVTNSFNIIDGFNGLSAMVGVFILCGICYVAFCVNDYQIFIAAILMIGLLLGFLVFNYPRGFIFIGDSGAYLVGFWVAELSIMLTLNNATVSKWFPFLLCIYPIFETLFTIYRRLLRNNHPFLPDAIHLHQLIYCRVVHISNASINSRSCWKRNSMTAPYLWMLSLFAVVPAIIFWQYTLILQIFVFLFIFLYVFLYFKLVRFRTPKWMIIR